MQRRLPRWDDIKPLLKIQPPGLGAEARLAHAADVYDLRRIAKRRTPRAPFDYTDGGADQEIALRRSREAYRRTEWQEVTVLRDVSEVDTSTSILGAPSSLPVAFAPTGFTRMMQHEGEPAIARAADRAGLTYALSTLGTTTPEDVATAAPTLNRWFQLYLFKDREFSGELLRRAKESGYSAVILTVDTAIPGARLRDIRNGLTVPPSLTLRTMFDMALHPAWWFNLLTTEPLEFATMRNFDGTVAEIVAKTFDPTLNWSDIDWMRDHWDGKLVIKGIQSVADAERAVDHGADAVIVSNHGGRQLDRAPTTFELLPHVVDAVGDKMEVYVDGGIMDGADALAAVAQGATAAFIGRAYLYALMAGGEHGVDRLIEMFKGSITRTMQLLGVTSLKELGRNHLKIRNQ
ncbi:MAG: alpha-hydroxy-acid oxidizing protein [Acidimicrobiia bacterium]|nr:alpha-hydroxy-acid oxidizing protein [Acidimicrobiia bacterium]